MHSILRRISPELFFLIWSVPCGLLFAFLTPPFQAPDEESHFFRAYQISEGDFIPSDVGGVMPESAVAAAKAFTILISRPNLKINHPKMNITTEDILFLLHEPLAPERKVFVPFPGAVLYSPVSYIPQSITFKIGRALRVSALGLLYLGRTANLVVWAFLIYWAVKSAPIGKWLLVFLSLMPMTLFQASSLSADAFTIGVAFLLISLGLRLFAAPQIGVRLSEVIPIALLSLLLALCKSIYLPVSLLFILILISRKGLNRSQQILFVLLAFTNIAMTYFWNYTTVSIIVGPPPEKIESIFLNPLKFLMMIYETVHVYGCMYAEEFIGTLGWLDTELPNALRVSYFLVLVVAAYYSASLELVISIKQKALMMIFFCSVALLIFISLFLFWTPDGSNIIKGIQGRYFIPISPLLFLAFQKSRVDQEKFNRYMVLFAPLFILFSMSMSLYALVKRYYYFE